MNRERLDRLITTYREGLLNDTLPFWLQHSIDREHGGYRFCLDRDGSLIDTDKGMWQHGRFAWLLATLADSVTEVSAEQRQEWLDLACHGLDFLERHAFDPNDGRMYFVVTQDGRPVRKRRYVFTEAFAAIAFAATAKATGEPRYRERAIQVFQCWLDHQEPGRIPPKVDPGTRPTRGLAGPMINLVTARILRDALGDDTATAAVDTAIDAIRGFVRPDLEAVLEVTGEHGEVLDHFDGRTLNPGHALEAAWFILDEAWQRGGDPELTALGTSMVDWMWKRGWDSEHGGILYFTDLRGLPVQEYWHDMKFWWPQNEAILATLMAYRATRDSRYAQWHTAIHDWAHAHFPDSEHGEWFGYLHRDGRISTRLKGNLWKGPFHLPRMQLLGWRVAEELRAAT